MDTISTLPQLRALLQNWRQAGQHIALVPTMGALHVGHMALVEYARKRAGKVVMSIFVNPTQFGPNEDFDRYPRTLEADQALAAKYGVDAIWAPTAHEMYPEGFATSIHVAKLGDGLCGAHRPGHFDGVATVVSKLLLQTLPDMACFGEKDFQQLAIIKRMVADINIPTAIHGVPIVREADGLALSSRNRYLSEPESDIAPMLHNILQHAAAEIRTSAPVALTLEHASQMLLHAGFASVDYLEYVDRDTLDPQSILTNKGRLLAAVYLGKTRLIDNIEV